MTADAALRVLLAEDDAALVAVLETLLAEAGFEVETGIDGAAALAAFEAALDGGRPPDVVVSDINMPKMDGLTLIDRLHALDPEVPVVFITAYSSIDSAVAALRKGAFDYVTKPFRNDQLLKIAQNAARARRLATENRSLRREVARVYGTGDIEERSPGLGPVLRVVEKAAPSQASILIRGETGTGKELIARALHRSSPRAGRAFVSINCAALPEGLLESELFGHEKGAFTGAVSKSQGLFRAATGGTLFLDEVGEMPASLQAKLLRVLEAREVRPVGATKSVPVDVRIVAATNRDLLGEVEAGAFREDLYYRLAVIEIEVPPLRRRPDDVPLLARFFLDRITTEQGGTPRPLSAEAIDRLRAYPWPGNVRELLNALEHAAALGGDPVGVGDLPERIRRWAGGKLPGRPAGGARGGGGASGGGGDLDELPTRLADLERWHTERVLDEAGGDRRRAAKVLGIDLSTLYRKIKRWEESTAEDVNDGASADDSPEA